MRKESRRSVRTLRLGPLPLINHFLARLALPALLERFVPTTDSRCRLAHGKSLAVLLRSILVEREPIYRQQETVRSFAPGAFGLAADEIESLHDDTIGRALDRLFDADRGTLLTAVVVRARERFRIRLHELHNDTTSIRLTGQYRAARGRSIRGRRAPWITYGHSKDHRPDLKQLLWVLTTSADGGIPVQFRSADGNVSDAQTHIATWEALCEVTGRRDFLYVADSKLCSGENMDYIDRRRGRFVVVLPRTRREDGDFRAWIQDHEPEWETVWDRPNPRRRSGPRDVWRVFRSPLPSREGWPVVWVWSSLLALQHEQSRQARLARAIQDLERLRGRLSSPRPRLRSRSEVERRVARIVRGLKVEHYLRIAVTTELEHRFVQEHRGRPGPETRYRRQTSEWLRLHWELDEEKLAYDRRSAGMYPLLTNDRKLSPRQVLEAHKRQPALEKRFQQLKSVHEIAPVFLKNEGRIEAFFFLYFLALVVQAVIERELRTAMRRERIESLPLYPEERQSHRPTAEQVLRLFAHVEGHVLQQGGSVEPVDPDLSDLQRQTLKLLEVPARVYSLATP